MPVVNLRSSQGHRFGSNLAYDANRRRMVHGPLQPMDADPASGRSWLGGFWRRLLSR